MTLNPTGSPTGEDEPCLLSARSVEPTVIAFGTNAGLKRHASLFEFPAATTTVTPAVLAESTARCILDDLISSPQSRNQLR